MQTDTILEAGRQVIRTEVEGLTALAEGLDQRFAQAVDLILASEGRVIVSGMGKSGHVARKIAATLASTGTPAQFVHPAEASHGDLGMITRLDVCLLLSGSGETAELADVIAHSRRYGIPLIGVSRREGSTLMRQADLRLMLPDAPEACAIGLAPTTSTTQMLALGDALAVTLMRLRGFDRTNFFAFHPGGTLGAQLLPVRALMHSGEALPVVQADSAMSEALLVMSQKGFGVVAVLDGARLAGVITDGDLRRNMDRLLDRRAGDVATRDPRRISPDALASEALGVMTRLKITTLLVADADGPLEGLIHLHDCLRAGVA